MFDNNSTRVTVWSLFGYCLVTLWLLFGHSLVTVWSLFGYCLVTVAIKRAKKSFRY